MSKKTKEHKPVSRAALLLRQKVAENVLLLMERRFPAARYRTASDREKELAKEAGCSWSTIQRVLAPIKTHVKRRGQTPDEDGSEGIGTKIDTIADLAVVFGVSAADLLTPNFAHQTSLRGPLAPPIDDQELQRPSSGRVTR